MIALDTETCLIAPGLLAPPLVCMSLASGQGWQVLAHWTQSEHYAADLLARGETLIGHNIAYDMAVLGQQFPNLLPAIFQAYRDNLIEDTGIRMKLLDLACSGVMHKKYSLADLTKRLLGRDLNKGADTWRLRYAELRDTSCDEWPADARQYSLDDAATLECWQVQEAMRLDGEKDYLADQHRQARAAWWLHLTSCWGIHTDPAAVRRFVQAAQADYDAIANALVEAGLLRSPKMVKGESVEGARNTKAATRRMLLANPDAKRTDAGTVCLDRESCKASGDPLLVKYAELSALKKVLGTDVPLLLSGAIQPIQTRYETLKKNGRTGSSNPNIQNLPRQGHARECFVPRPGYVFAIADYSGFELRTFAQFCLSMFGRSRLADLLNDGLDPHLSMASIMAGTSYDDITARYQAQDPEAIKLRDCGKVANFGFPGGLGIASLIGFAASAHKVHLTESQAKDLKATWQTFLPEARTFFDYIATITDQGFPQIKQLTSNRWRGGVGYTDACNTCFSGLAADAAKAAGFEIAEACYVKPGPLLGARIVNFVHDEFDLEVRDDETAHDAATELARIMVDVAQVWIPDVKIKAVPLLARRWSKRAKPMHDADGRLIPWDC